MNVINIFFNKKKWCGFESKGHINENNDNNFNLICAAISMHLQTIAFVLEKYYIHIRIEKKNGFLKVIFKKDKEIPEHKGIESCFFEGINLLKKSYNKYLKIYNKEVKNHDHN